MSVQNSNIPSYLYQEVHRVAAPGVNALVRGERQRVHGAARDLQQHEAAGDAPRHRRVLTPLNAAHLISARNIILGTSLSRFSLSLVFQPFGAQIMS